MRLEPRRMAIALLLAALLNFYWVSHASATPSGQEPGSSVTGGLNSSGKTGDISAWAQRRKQGAEHRRVGSARVSTHTQRTPRGSTHSTNSALAEYNRKYSAWAAYQTAMLRWASCPPAQTCSKPTQAVPRPQYLTAVAMDATPAPAVSPEQAAYIAVARLHLTPPKPMIGPPPEINEWKMAAVGYPMWLWAEGNLNPAPVSDTVYDLTVSLDARLVKVTFDMGDGHRQTCADVSHRWVRGTTPGAPSPGCGHTYTRPSLPKGKYTITAYSEWAVDWSVNGVGGTIPMYQQAGTSLPVGELQVLVH